MNTQTVILPFRGRTDIDKNIDEINKLRIEKSLLMEQLEEEKRLRYQTEEKLAELQKQLQPLSPKPRASPQKTEKPYSDFKSDGKRKPHAAESIRSYADFKAIQGYFLSQEKIRDWALWTIGVSLGLRISDLLSLKIGNFLYNGSFRERLVVIEQKTEKLNNCLITESVTNALTKYFESINWNISVDDYLFKSNKTKDKMREEYGWKIISDAGKALNLPITIGSHTMRKSFANIAACVDKSSIDMNSITKIQGLLNHSNQQVTMRYLGAFQKMFDRARVSVSDFVLGKTDVQELIAGNNYTIDDIMLKIDHLEQKILK